MTRFDLDTFLPYQLAVLSARTSRAFSTLYKQKYGISVPEWRVVANLGKSGPVSIREIHARVNMDKSKVSRAASRLREIGFVSSKPDPRDGRLIILELTAKGRDMIDELAPLADRFQADLLAVLGEDAHRFRTAVEALLKHMPDT